MRVGRCTWLCLGAHVGVSDCMHVCPNEREGVQAKDFPKLRLWDPLEE